MRKLLYILLLISGSVSAQLYPVPIIHENNNYHFTKTIFVDRKFKVGVGSDINQDVELTADTLRLTGLDGTGLWLGIDLNGDVTRTTIGAGGVSGLVPTEVLFGKSDGTIDQDPDFYYDEGAASLVVKNNGNISVINAGLTEQADLQYNALSIGDGTNSSSLTKYYFQLAVGANSTSIYRQSGGSSYNINLPNANGINGQALRLNAGLNLEWFTPSTGTVTSIATTSPIGGGTITTTGTLNLLGSAADRILYTTGVNTWAETVSTSFGRSLMDDADAAAGLATLSIPTTANQILFGDGTDIASSSDLTFDPATSILDLRTNFIVDGSDGHIKTYGGSTGSDGQLFIGNTVGGDWQNGALSSSDLTIGYSAPDITLSYAAGSIVNADINASAAIDATKIADGSVTSTEFQYINTLSSNAQTQLNTKPTIVATVNLTAQTAAIAATTAYTTPAADGFYQVNWVASVTTAGTVGSILGPFQVRNTNATDNVVKTFPTSAVNFFTQSNANTTGTSISGTFTVYCKASTAIQYIMGYTSNAAASMNYDLNIQIIKL